MAFGERGEQANHADGGILLQQMQGPRRILAAAPGEQHLPGRLSHAVAPSADVAQFPGAAGQQSQAMAEQVAELSCINR